MGLLRALGIVVVMNSNLEVAVGGQGGHVGEETGLKPQEVMTTIPLILL